MWYRILLILIMFSLCTACQQVVKPEEVALSFWQAVQKEDINSIKRLSNLKHDDEYSKFIDKIEITSIKTGKIVIDGEQAEVETTLGLNKPESYYSVTTYLHKDKDQWRVDFNSTMSVFMIGQDVKELIKDIEILSEEFTKQIEDSVDEIKKKAVPKIRSKVKELEQELEKKIPEVRDRIFEFLEELERSIELPPEPTQQEPSTTQT